MVNQKKTYAFVIEPKEGSSFGFITQLLITLD